MGAQACASSARQGPTRSDPQHGSLRCEVSVLYTVEPHLLLAPFALSCQILGQAAADGFSCAGVPPTEKTGASFVVEGLWHLHLPLCSDTAPSSSGAAYFPGDPISAKVKPFVVFPFLANGCKIL